MTKTPKLAIIVQSCDAYADVWSPFFQLFDRYWADCPYSVYLVSETVACTIGKCKTILPGKERSWSDRLQFALQSLEEEYILFMQEDYFLNKPVNTSRIQHLFQICISENIPCLRLYPAINSPLIEEESLPFGKIDKLKEPFVVSTQASIWQKDFMSSLLVSGESVWDVERNASSRALHLNEQFYSVPMHTAPNKLDQGDYPITYLFLTSITRGRWTMKTVRFCKKAGVELDFKKRKAHNWIDELYMSDVPNFLRHVVDFVNARTIKYFSLDIRAYPMR